MNPAPRAAIEPGHPEHPKRVPQLDQLAATPGSKERSALDQAASGEQQPVGQLPDRVGR